MDTQPSPEQIKTWIENFLAGTISEADRQSLEAWFRTMPEGPVEWKDAATTGAGQLEQRMLHAIDARINRQEHRLRYRRRRRALLASGLLLAVAAGGWLLLQTWRNPGKTVAQKAAIEHDVQPGSTVATLLLADGKEIKLDSAHTVNVTTMQGRICLLNQHGNTTYVGNIPGKAAGNTLTTHRGEQAPAVTLPDGTKVWLNAASTLHFPSTFANGAREVALSGEAYFEVAKDAAHPFIVSTASDRVEVLGTHFDVMAYPDEQVQRATLLEGSIRVRRGGNSALLHPGQQARTSAGDAIKVSEVDPDESVAWMYGRLPLRKMDIPSFMRSVSRWYDVNVEYEGPLPTATFSAMLIKDVPLSQLLVALDANGVHCRLQGRTVIVGQHP